MNQSHSLPPSPTPEPQTPATKRSYDIKVQGSPITLKVLDPVDIKACGECRACCTVLGVKEFDKPNYRPCEHECNSGCAIYEKRPESCRGYLCGWKWGMIVGEERRRPDKLGVIFDFQPFPPPGVIRAWEVWPDAASDPAARYLIQKLEQKFSRQVFVIDRELGEAINSSQLPDGYWEAAEQFQEDAGEQARSAGVFDDFRGNQDPAKKSARPQE